jgi:hypothetical protein
MPPSDIKEKKIPNNRHQRLAKEFHGELPLMNSKLTLVNDLTHGK